MTPGARVQAAIELLDEIWSGTRPADTVVDAYFRKRRYAGSGDRRAISERLYAMIRRRARLDWWIGRTGSQLPLGPRTRMVADLALGDKLSPQETAELFSGTKHCPEPLSETETELADALYGRPLTHRDMPAPVAHEYPDWMDRSLRTLWGDKLETEISALNQPAPVDLRVNTLKATREQAQASLAAEFVDAEATPLSPLGLRLRGHPRLGGTQAFKEGLVEVQDEGSQLVALLSDARPGMTVIDFCAGAGGKTLALAAAMGEEGRIQGRLTACDISEIRMNRMEPRLRRAGAKAVRRRVVSARDDEWVAAQRASADRVLADVPCTNTGLWRRDPDAKWRFTPTDLDNIREQQQNVLSTAATLVAPGGRLIYSTCSLLQEENELHLAAFVEATPGFQALPIDEVWAETVGGPAPSVGPCLRLSPATSGTDGFFCAVLERTH